MSTLWLGFLVSSGAALGGLLRWGATTWFNPVWAGFPVGTLVVNLAGGFLAGAGYVMLGRGQHEAARLLLITGFLGGLTTFSTFSAESLSLLERGRPALALTHSLAHVLGALVLAALGARVARWLI